MTDLADWTFKIVSLGPDNMADVADWTIVDSSAPGGGGGGGGSVGPVGFGPVAKGTSAIAPTFAGTTTAGNLLVMLFAYALTTAPTVTGTGWNLAIGGHPSGFGWAGIYYRANCGSGESPPAITNWVGPNDGVAVLGEIQGIATSSPLDQTASGGNAVNPSNTATATAAAADASVSELVVAIAKVSNNANVWTWTDSFNNGTPVLIDNTVGIQSGLSFQLHLAYALTTANANADAWTTTISTGTGRFDVTMASFKHA